VVTVFNAYSAESQRLIANTRFEAPDAKIYRVRDSVTVPGATKKADGTLVPGSITATLYADSPGPAYNRSGTTVFTIPGFKGDPRYEKFSAQSQGGISGGFVGAEPAVAETELVKARTELQKQVDEQVRSAAATVIPPGYTAIPGSLHVTFSTIAQAPGGGNTALVSQSATASGAIVQLSNFASMLARKWVPEYKGEAVLLDPASQIQASTATTTDLASGSILISVEGTAILVWQFDPNALTQALLGKPKSQFQAIVESFAPAIRCTSEHPCDASIRPFWQTSFPNDPAKIKVDVPK
jgi:hypothetical protein